MVRPLGETPHQRQAARHQDALHGSSPELLETAGTRSLNVLPGSRQRWRYRRGAGDEEPHKSFDNVGRPPSHSSSRYSGRGHLGDSGGGKDESRNGSEVLHTFPRPEREAAAAAAASAAKAEAEAQRDQMMRAHRRAQQKYRSKSHLSPTEDERETDSPVVKPLMIMSGRSDWMYAGTEESQIQQQGGQNREQKASNGKHQRKNYQLGRTDRNITAEFSAVDEVPDQILTAAKKRRNPRDEILDAVPKQGEGATGGAPPKEYAAAVGRRGLRPALSRGRETPVSFRDRAVAPEEDDAAAEAEMSMRTRTEANLKSSDSPTEVTGKSRGRSVGKKIRGVASKIPSLGRRKKSKSPARKRNPTLAGDDAGTAGPGTSTGRPHWDVSGEMNPESERVVKFKDEMMTNNPGTAGDLGASRPQCEISPFFSAAMDTGRAGRGFLENFSVVPRGCDDVKQDNANTSRFLKRNQQILSDMTDPRLAQQRSMPLDYGQAEYSRHPLQNYGSKDCTVILSFSEEHETGWNPFCCTRIRKA